MAMDLNSFFPWRLARLAEAVSQAIGQVYGERFELSRDEWRIVAALAGAGEVRTAHVLDSSALDKMRVSRALARLEERGLVARAADPQDGRGQLLRLLPPGEALHRKIVPMVQAREAFLLDALDAEERVLLDRLIDKLQQRATTLAQQG